MTEPRNQDGHLEAAHAANAALGVGIHLPNGLVLLSDIGAIFVAYKTGNIMGLVTAAKKLLADLGVPDPTPNDVKA